MDGESRVYKRRLDWNGCGGQIDVFGPYWVVVVGKGGGGSE